MLAAIFGRFVTSESIINLEARFMSICIRASKKKKKKKFCARFSKLGKITRSLSEIGIFKF